MRRFELPGEKPLFWQIEINGTKLRMLGGRVGTKGRPFNVAYPKEIQAQIAYQRHIEQKINAGYVEVDAEIAIARNTLARKKKPTSST